MTAVTTASERVADQYAAIMESADRVIADMGAAMTGILCAIGVRLGLFTEMARAGAVTSAELAGQAGVSERYAREWLYGLASAGYLEADPSGKRFTLPPSLAMIMTPGSPFSLAPGYRLFPALAEMVPSVSEAFRTGTGVPPEEYSAELYAAMEDMSATWFESMLVQQWIPAIDGMADRLGQGARVADIGCGHGRALITCAQAFPASEFVGFDMFASNIGAARLAAEEAGVSDRVWFEQADATTGLTGHYDLVTAFSVLHDAPRPAELLRAVRDAIAPDGVFLLLEANAADRPADSTGPAATVLYATSVLYCLPTSLAEGSPGLGTLGLTPERVRDYCGLAGFRCIRPVPQASPFNALYEIRP
jgi:2-polyprenyl-3-methyl-5-hydroxy-6-metoxy-1,4-benzoquinol methylase